MEYLAKLEPFLLEMHGMLENPLKGEAVTRFFQVTADFNAELKVLSQDYVTLTGDKIYPKSTLKYAYDVLEYVSFFARFEEVLANMEHEAIINFKKLIETRRELIATKYRVIAERELNAFNDEDFRKRLSDDLERMMGL